MKPINLKQMCWMPNRWEHQLSVNLSKVSSKVLKDWAKTKKLSTEMVIIEYPNRSELHLMLICQTLPEGTVLGFEYDELIDQLQDIDVPDDAVRHCYGGRMATLAQPA